MKSTLTTRKSYGEVGGLLYFNLIIHNLQFFIFSHITVESMVIDLQFGSLEDSPLHHLGPPVPLLLLLGQGDHAPLLLLLHLKKSCNYPA